MTDHWSQLIQNAPLLYEMAAKNAHKLVMFIDYVPLLGPVYNASHALQLLMAFWCGVATTSESDLSNEDLIKRKEKSRKVREKGLVAIFTALIDIFTICLAVAVIAFICDCLTRIQTFAIVRSMLILFIMINVLALTIGAKIISGQIIINLTRQLEDVNHVSTSMVKSVTITATAIERTITTTDLFVRYCQQCWNAAIIWLYQVITYPHRKTVQTYQHTELVVKRTIVKAERVVKQTLKVDNIVNLMTLGFYERVFITWTKNKML